MFPRVMNDVCYLIVESLVLCVEGFFPIRVLAFDKFVEELVFSFDAIQNAIGDPRFEPSFIIFFS